LIEEKVVWAEARLHPVVVGDLRENKTLPLMNADKRRLGNKFKRQQGKKWGSWTFFLKRFLKHKVPPAYSRAD